jgi:uncharacterized surface protein with fasciclin (FAS1) repeats
MVSFPAAARLEANPNVLNSPAHNNTGTTPQQLNNSTGIKLIAQTPPVRNSIIVELETANSAFKTLSTAIKAANLDDDLAKRGAYTIFAPTDEAFAALPPGMLDRLLRPENKGKLVRLLTYHIIPGKTNSFHLKSGRRETFEGKSLRIRVTRLRGTEIRVNGAKVILADIPARNGIIYAINKVLVPPDFNL